MSVKDMWKVNATTLVLLVFVNLMVFSLGNTAWIVLGLVLLASGMFLSFRQGMGLGHEACAIAETARRANDPSSSAYGQLDKDVLKRTWSVERGIKGMMVSVLIPYVINVVYIICMLLDLEPMKLPTRLVAWVITLPFWPIIVHWYEAFDVLTPAIVAVLMISPFLLPACTFAGYMQGPKLWEKSEKAMAQGRRRARAKSRVAQKKKPRVQKPEI